MVSHHLQKVGMNYINFLDWRQTNFGHQIWSAQTKFGRLKVICTDHFLTKLQFSLQDYFVGSYVSTCNSKYEAVKVNCFAVANLYFTQMATISKFKNTVCGKSLVITNHIWACKVLLPLLLGAPGTKKQKMFPKFHLNFAIAMLPQRLETKESLLRNVVNQ